MTDDRHSALVRLVALLWTGSDTSGEHRLARAHRLARRALRQRPTREGRPDYREARGRVLRHVLVEEQQPKPARLAWRLQLEPVAPNGAAARLSAEISGMTPESRAAYLLVRLEGLDEEGALGELAAAGRRAVVDPAVTLARVEAATGLSAERQRELLTGPDLDPTYVRLSRRTRLGELLPRPSGRHLAVAGVAVLAVAATAGIPVAVGEVTRPADPWDDVRTVAADEWHGATRPGFDVWPTTGGLRDDTTLLREAAQAWYGAGRDVSVDLHDWPTPFWRPARTERVQVLFAGNVDGLATVLMRQRDLLAQYTRPGPAEDSGDDPDSGTPRLTVRPLPHPGASRSVGILLPLATDGGAVRFLLPPWLTGLRVSGLTASRPSWRPVRVDDGGTAVLPGGERAGCRSAVLVSWESQDSRRFAVYRPEASSPTRLGLIRPAEDGTANLLRSVTSPEALRALRGVLCDDALLSRDVTVGSLDLGVVWRGRLPEGGGRVALVYVAARYVGSDAVSGRATEAAAFVDASDPGRPASTYPVARRPYRGGSITESGAAATWWRAGSGRWYYVVAGGSNVQRIRLSGDVAQDVYGQEAVVAGPDAADPKELPTVKVEAFDAAGEPVPVATS